MSLTAIEFLLGPLPHLILILVVTITGSIFAIRRRIDHPVASRLVIIGLITIVVDAIGSYAVRIYGYRSFDKWQDASIHGRHIAELYAVLHLIDVAGIILIVAAVFANRLSALKAPNQWLERSRGERFR